VNTLALSQLELCSIESTSDDTFQFFLAARHVKQGYNTTIMQGIIPYYALDCLGTACEWTGVTFVDTKC